jgi:hypothetical protein
MTTETESDLLKLSRSYLGECRHGKKHVSGKGFKFSETKIDAAEVGVVSQVNEEMF